MCEANRRYTPSGQEEGAFRRIVRTLLDLDVFTRDEQIFNRIKELKEASQRETARS